MVFHKLIQIWCFTNQRTNAYPISKFSLASQETFLDHKEISWSNEIIILYSLYQLELRIDQMCTLTMY